MKQFKIQTEALKAALSKLTNGVSRNAALPVLSNIYCKVKDGVVEFVSTDTEITIQYLCECETQGVFEFLMPFPIVQKIVSLNKGKEVAFIQEGKGIRIVGENDKYGLKSLESKSNFPKIPAIEKPSFQILPDTILDLLNSALKTVSKDDSRPHLKHVLLEIKRDKTTVVSTEGSYMVFTCSVNSASDNEAQLLISEKAIKTLDGSTNVQVAWDDKYIVFKTDLLSITVTKTEYNYVNYAAVFPAGFVSNLRLDRAELISALEKCSINSSPFKHTSVELGTKGKVYLKANDSDYNIEIDVELSGDYEGECERIMLSASMLLRLLNQVSYQTIDLAIHSPIKPVLIRSSDNDGYLSLLMPASDNR